MKATGIVRRMDDLGRVVIPREVRRTLRLQASDPLEIYTGEQGDIVLKKYSPLRQLREVAGSYTGAMARSLGCGVLICDTEKVLSAAGTLYRPLENRPVTRALEERMNSRKTYVYSKGERWITPCEGCEAGVWLACPILPGGSPAGAVLLLTEQREDPPREELRRTAGIAAAFLTSYLEA